MNDLELTIKQVIDKYELLNNRARSKSFGQHFLCDSSLLKKIASCAAPFSPDEQDIIEIGPGPTGLTRAIMDISSNSKVICIEKDENLKPVHDSLLKCYECIDHYRQRLSFIYDDALDVNLSTVTNKQIVIISNLPYNVGTQLLLNWVHNIEKIDRMILMFQKEVADRITASVGTKTYGRLSVIIQLLCRVEKIFDISNRAFYPPPKITSTVIKLTPIREIDFDINRLENLTSICFQQRRKTIFSILKKHQLSIELLESALETCCIEKNDRPENISPQQFLQLSQVIEFATNF